MGVHRRPWRSSAPRPSTKVFPKFGKIFFGGKKEAWGHCAKAGNSIIPITLCCINILERRETHTRNLWIRREKEVDNNSRAGWCHTTPFFSHLPPSLKTGREDVLLGVVVASLVVSGYLPPSTAAPLLTDLMSSYYGHRRRGGGTRRK